VGVRWGGTGQRHSGAAEACGRGGLLGYLTGAVGGAERLFAGDFRSAASQDDEKTRCEARRRQVGGSRTGRAVQVVWYGVVYYGYGYGSLGMTMDLLRRLDAMLLETASFRAIAPTLAAPRNSPIDACAPCVLGLTHARRQSTCSLTCLPPALHKHTTPWSYLTRPRILAPTTTLVR
jgi:hypothetical protein